MGTSRFCVSIPVALVLFLSVQLPARSAPITTFDFTNAREAASWRPAHDISSSRAGAQGLIVTISGEDPYLVGPPRDYPANVPLRVTIRLKSEAGGSAQLFYFFRGATEEASVRFDVPAGKWVESKGKRWWARHSKYPKRPSNVGRWRGPNDDGSMNPNTAAGSP